MRNPAHLRSTLPVPLAGRRRSSADAGRLLARLQGEVAGHCTCQLLTNQSAAHTSAHSGRTNQASPPAVTSLTASWRQIRLSSANRALSRTCRLRLLSCSSAIRSFCFLLGQVRGSAHRTQVRQEAGVTDRFSQLVSLTRC